CKRPLLVMVRIPAGILPIMTQIILIVLIVISALPAFAAASCRFDPSVLLCKGEDGNSCLTAPQVAALKKLYDGPRNAKGQRVLPGYSPGGEVEPKGWAQWMTGTQHDQSLLYAFGTQFFKNLIL